MEASSQKKIARFDASCTPKKMKNIHHLFFSYKTMIFKDMIRKLTKVVINKSCV